MKRIFKLPALNFDVQAPRYSMPVVARKVDELVDRVNELEALLQDVMQANNLWSGR